MRYVTSHEKYASTPMLLKSADVLVAATGDGNSVVKNSTTNRYEACLNHSDN
jgi:hypothetical protein